MKILETERLILRRIEMLDAAFLMKLMNEPAYHQNIGDRGVRTLQLAQNFITDNFLNSYKKFGFGLYVVAVKNTNEPIGICGLIQRDALEDVDIGFAFLEKFQRKGFGFESALATLDYAKNKIGLKKIVAIVKAENTVSIHLLEKIGLQFERMIQMPDLEKEDRLYSKCLL